MNAGVASVANSDEAVSPAFQKMFELWTQLTTNTKPFLVLICWGRAGLNRDTWFYRSTLEWYASTIWPIWNDVADGAAGLQLVKGPQHRLLVTVTFGSALTTDRLTTFCARPPRSTMRGLVGCFELGHASPQYITLHMSRHCQYHHRHRRQRLMSVRLPLHAASDEGGTSTGLCLMRYLSWPKNTGDVKASYQE